MKKLFFASLILFSWTAHGEKVSSILYPTNQELRKACDQSFSDPENVQIIEDLYVFDGEIGNSDAVFYQTSVGGVKSICASDARKLELKKYPTEFFDVAVVASYGKVTELSEARKWAAIMVVKNTNGKEIARIQASKASSLGDTSNWDVDCSDDCSWSGANYYYFKLGNSAFKKAVMSGGKVFIVNQRYGEISSYELKTKALSVDTVKLTPVAPATTKPTTKPQNQNPSKGPLHPNIAFVSLLEFSQKIDGVTLTMLETGGSLTLNDVTLLFETSDQTYTNISNGGETKSLPALPIAKSGNLFVPARALEGLGCVVGFNAQTNSIAANCPQSVDGVESRVDISLSRL